MYHNALPKIIQLVTKIKAKYVPLSGKKILLETAIYKLQYFNVPLIQLILQIHALTI
jgi:hypothetical protein